MNENKNILIHICDTYLWFTFLGFVAVVLQLLLREELLLAVVALEDLLHVDEHVLVQGLPVDEELAAVVAEHAGIQEVVVLHLEMFLHLRQLFKILTAPVAAK